MPIQAQRISLLTCARFTAEARWWNAILPLEGTVECGFAKFIPSGMPSPLLWGDEAVVRERFGSQVCELRFVRRHYTFDYPFPPSEVVNFFRLYYGPVNRAFASLDRAGRKNLHQELEAIWSAHNRGRDAFTLVAAEYLEVIATRV